jgi:capsule assembly protein Wzi
VLRSSLALLVALCCLNENANAQTYTFLPSGHWAREALYRLALNGTTDITSAALGWPASRADLGEWLDTTRVASEPRAAFFRSILAREQPGDHRVHAQLSASWAYTAGVVRAGLMQRSNGGYSYPGPERLPDADASTVSGAVEADVVGPFALGVHARTGTDTTAVDAAYVTLRTRRLEAWAGRRGFSVGTRGSDNLVLNEVNTFDGVGLSARRGVSVPILGRLHPELLLARLPRNGTLRHPWFHAARITVVPAPSFVFGLNRAAIFGGGEIDVTAARVLLMLAGLPDTKAKDSDFENQVASIDVLWRTRVGNVPVGLYGELGADDSGWAFVYVPGVVAGIEIAEMPGLAELMLGVEVAHIAERTGTYPPWYQHGALAYGWTQGGRLLGHSLGGAGTQLAVQWRIDAPRTPLIASGQVFVRERRPENLLAPLHQGRSGGGRLELLVPWWRMQLGLRGDLELGNAWQTSSLAVIGSLFW